jgi:DNA-binding NtrC family response regulator
MRRTEDDELLGASGLIAELNALVAHISRSDAKVLITGASGIVQEVIARAIHAVSRREPRFIVFKIVQTVVLRRGT